MRISSRSPSYMETDVTSKARTRSAKPASAPQSGGRQQRRVAIVGGNRIPFARSDRAYAHASNQDMFTATLDGLVSRFGLQGERLGMVVGGAVLKHSRDFNLMRECVLGSALSPEFVTQGQTLILNGPSGTGKTHLAVAIAYRAIQNGFEARFTTAGSRLGFMVCEGARSTSTAGSPFGPKSRW